MYRIYHRLILEMNNDTRRIVLELENICYNALHSHSHNEIYLGLDNLHSI